MRKEDRKAVVSAYKELDRAAGIFAVRCAAADAVWVGKAADVRTIANRLRFTLGQGSSPFRSLQAAWRRHGEAAFVIETLEVIDPELADGLLPRALQQHLLHWQSALGAESL